MNESDLTIPSLGYMKMVAQATGFPEMRWWAKMVRPVMRLPEARLWESLLAQDGIRFVYFLAILQALAHLMPALSPDFLCDCICIEPVKACNHGSGLPGTDDTPVDLSHGDESCEGPGHKSFISIVYIGE